MVAFVLAGTMAAILSIALSVIIIQRNAQDRILLENRIDPNTATIGSLVRLPGIGIGRASAIIAYRENRSNGGPAFSDCNDLDDVTGIGPVTINNICEHLTFEESKSNE